MSQSLAAFLHHHQYATDQWWQPVIDPHQEDSLDMMNSRTRNRSLCGPQWDQATSLFLLLS